MRLMAPRNIRVAGVLVMMMLLVGCSYTRINFVGPPGAVLFVSDKPYHLPAQVEFERPDSAGSSKRYDVSLVFTSQLRQEVRTKGFIDIFGYHESDVDHLPVNTCYLDETQLVKILNRTVVILRGRARAGSVCMRCRWGGNKVDRA